MIKIENTGDVKVDILDYDKKNKINNMPMNQKIRITKPVKK